MSHDWLSHFDSAFDALDHFLSGRSAPRGDWTDDEWGDYASLRADEALAAFAQPDWGRLAEAWKERSPMWQSRLAEVLPDAAPVQAGPILTELNRHLQGMRDAEL